MATLKGKAKGDFSPQGKPKVYVSCHSTDFDLYFKEICHDIWRTHDCAIYYYDESDGPVVPDEEYYARLGEMQLFVMPVTGRLLLDANRGRDVELPFAKENHKPVLPIMLENGLGKTFGKIFGDLQFLDKYTQDVTAIAYEEKLKKFLDSVFIDDALAQKVRAAFDAYIFLSYRKKDRKYAQELMRLIHKNQFCRDIAIWYDEFLTPGEDFNNAIEEALKKSDLFALAVTPNLLEVDNYVMLEEYPMAKREGKLIFPAELVQTDKTALQEKYREIPDCTDVHDEGALSDALLHIVQNIAKKENDNDPQHNFFIGLAYLTGIDVEIDHEKAVMLITSAAEAGLVEAMEKLAQMYYNGEGVTKDYGKVLEWKEKIVTAEEKTLRFSYAKALLELGDFCFTQGMLLKAKEVYVKLEEVAQALWQQSSQDLAKMYLIKSYEGLGRASQRLECYEEARQFFQKGLALCEACYEALETIEKDWKEDQEGIELYLCLAKVYQRLAYLEKEEGKKGFVHWLFKSHRIFYSLAQLTGTITVVGDSYVYTGKEMQVAQQLAFCEQGLGEYFMQTNQFSAAKAKYENALEIRNGVAQLAKNGGTLYWVAFCCEKLGDVCRAEGDLKQARALYFKGLNLPTPGAPKVEEILRNEFDAVWKKAIFPQLGAKFLEVEKNLLAQYRSEFSGLTALPDFMLLMTDDNWNLDYNVPHEDVWHSEILNHFLEWNLFLTKEAWVEALQAEYMLLAKKRSNLQKILSAFEKAIIVLQKLSLKEIIENKWRLKDVLPDEDVCQYEILESFFRRNTFSTKEAWVKALQVELLLATKECIPENVLSAAERAIAELEALSLEEIKEAKEMIADGE